MTKEKAREFWEEYKEKIKTVAKIAVGVTIAVVIGKKIKKSLGTASYTPKPVDIPIPSKPDLEVPTELVKQGFYAEGSGPDWIDMITEDDVCLTIDDLHEAVENLKKIKGFNDDSTVQAMFGVYVGNEE
jgi:hypothetical protein